MNRPTETVTAAVASVVAAVLVILQAFYPEAVEKVDANVTAAIVLLLSWTATVVTWIVSRRLTEGSLVSRDDGSVTSETPPTL
jgi:Na+/melibiose symporter-like transporter